MEAKPIGQIIAKLQAKTSAPLTKARVPNIAAWADWFQFRLCQDPQLEKLLTAATNFTLDLKAWMPNPWLIITGTSGVGKSYVAKRIWKWWQNHGRWFTEPNTGANCVLRGQYCLWADYIRECREGDFSRGVDLQEDHLVILEDIGAGTDARAWMADKLYHILEHRMEPHDDGRPRATLVTANLTVEQLGDAYDNRIASRLVRMGLNKVIEVNTTDYALRPQVEREGPWSP